MPADAGGVFADGFSFDLFPPFDNGLAAPEVDVSRRQGQARARQVGHSGGARARGRNGAAVCGPAINDAPSYRAAEAPLGREVQRNVLIPRCSYVDAQFVRPFLNRLDSLLVRHALELGLIVLGAMVSLQPMRALVQPGTMQFCQDATAVQETVGAAVVSAVPDDLARNIDAAGKGGSANGRWIIENVTVGTQKRSNSCLTGPSP